ncbi:DUF4386 domain-containing protein [Candidatus Dojkabacteria bacterium]|uniref:DUF4386 domain-containing protein n=1 Tax=Candidatus Dojkabacteria bacterium TaxID=2099670 RepID=A0A955LAT7_9BACT|nr:DUF4386 domain-containing protein [Candidatus Dojkabacteria bacterium]
MFNLNTLSHKQIVNYLRVMYPLWMIVGMFSLLYIPSLIIGENAAETANNIIQNETTFRLGIASGLITQLFQVVVVLFIYKLFASIDSAYSKFLVISALVGVPISMASYVFKLGAIELVHGGSYLSSFDTAQLQSLAMYAFNLSEHMVEIASIFWGIWLLPIGYLVIKSKYMPKFIGWALYAGGIGYLISAFTNFIMPDAEVLLSLAEVLTFGEMIFIFWLLFRGIKTK